jgi:hypothetical protein
MHAEWFINTEIDEIGSIPGMAMEYGLEITGKCRQTILCPLEPTGTPHMDDLNLGVSRLQNRVLLQDCASMIFRMVFLGVHVARIHLRSFENI